MVKRLLLCLLAGLGLLVVHAQSGDSTGADLTHLPSKFFTSLSARSGDLNTALTKQTQRYLTRLQRREERLRRKLARVDSASAQVLFANSAQQYAALSGKLAGGAGASFSGGGAGLPAAAGSTVVLPSAGGGEYQPYVDSMGGLLHYLQQAKNLSPLQQAQLAQASSAFQSLQTKFQDAGQVQAFIQQRKQQLADYIQQHTNFAGLLGKDYQGMNQDLYYYSQQVRAYREAFNDPDKLERAALSVLEKVPAFQSFMQAHSQLAGLFGLPANYGTPQGVAGLQTKDQIATMIQGQLSAGGPGGAASLQSSLQAGESQLDAYKDKLSQLGPGSGNIDMPDFTPNKQKAKTFWKRLEYATNFQTTRNSYYYPTVCDLGVSVGYKLNDRSTVGVGSAFGLGLGNGINHVAISGNGASLRSFINIRIKSSFSGTGGLEYNYSTPFRSYQDLREWSNWSKSGLIGITKTVSMKNRFFKQTNVQLLFDFLSFQQIPKTQPFVFRIGYGF